MIFPLIILLILLVPGWVAYVIGNAVHRNLLKAENPNATVIRVVTTIGSWIVIMVTILALLYFNVRLER
jgi:uncharacterized protein (UPF0333 family)